MVGSVTIPGPVKPMALVMKGISGHRPDQSLSQTQFSEERGTIAAAS